MKATIKSMQVAILHAMPETRGWNGFSKVYYNRKKERSEDWHPEKNSANIARDYKHLLKGIEDMLSTYPAMSINLSGELLIFTWLNGGGKMLVDIVDKKVLLPEIEKLYGKPIL